MMIGMAIILWSG